MPRSFDIQSILARFRPGGPRKDPRAVWNIVLAVLIAANLAAAFFVIRPIGGSPEQLDQQLAGLRAQVQRQQAAVSQLRALVKKVETARQEQDKFLSTYFLDGRTTASTILTEVTDLAKAAGLKQRNQTFPIEPIDGSDNLSLMTINGNYEGSFADLMQFVNLLDRSKRFLIIENIAATPQQAVGMLSFQCKIDAFVREVAE